MNNFLAITYAFMLGFCPYQSIAVGYAEEYYESPTHVSFELGVDLFDCVHLYAGEETFQVKDGSVTNWFPYSQSYWLGAEYHKEFSENLKLTAGIKRKCQHPLVCWGEKMSKYNKCCAEMYVGIEGKFDIF